MSKEVLINNDYFLCEKSIDEEGRVEWGISYKTSLEKTINHFKGVGIAYEESIFTCVWNRTGRIHIKTVAERGDNELSFLRKAADVHDNRSKRLGQDRFYDRD